MSNFDLAYQFVVKAEGGYSNYKNDRGGETNYGITHNTFKKAKELGIISDSIKSVKDITQDDAQKIYKEMYWDTINGDALPTDLAIALFDTAVNMGDKTSVKMLQKILGVTQDGIIGPQTLAAIGNYNGDLIDEFLDARESRYEAIAKHPGQGVFLKGWLNRLDALRDYLATQRDSSFIPLWIRNTFQDIMNRLADLYRSLFGKAEVTTSPILLDLDRDGVIQTLGTSAGTHFDHDGNGFKELSGWVAEGDGILVFDRNINESIDNGSELFGNFTPLANGMLAVNGFQALAQFDVNGDGKVDANDPIWSQLKVWQHDPEATDLGDPDTSGILKTLGYVMA